MLDREARVIRLYNRWPRTAVAKKFKYFAEASIELVHQKSWDSYRVYTLSSTTKLVELSLACGQVEQGEFPKPTIEPMIDEFNYASAKDPVLKECIRSLGRPDDFPSIEFKASVREIRNHATLLHDMSKSNYKPFCERAIEHLMFDSEKFSKIEMQLLLKLYYSHLINYGYSKRYIWSIINKTFVAKDVRRCSRKSLRAFFGEFPDDPRSFNVYAVVDGKFAKIAKDSLNLTLFSDPEKLEASGRVPLPENIITTPKQAILVFDGIVGYDQFGVTASVDRVFSLIQSFIFLQKTFYKPKWSSQFYVIPIKQKSGIVCGNERSNVAPNSHVSMRTLIDGGKRLTRLVFGDAPMERSAERLMRAVNTAALAGKTESKEAQLITLWAAFEALLPQVNPGEDVRIRHFCKYIVPGVCINYGNDQIDYVYKDLLKMFKNDFEAILDDRVEDENRSVSFRRLICCGNANLLPRLFNLVTSSELAVFRIFGLCKKFQSAKLFSKMCSDHDSRVNWQLQRIYRERNLIMHSGKTSPFLDGLIDNSYSYFTSTINRLEAVSQSSGVKRLDGAITALRLLYDGHTREREHLVELARLEGKSEGEVIFAFLNKLSSQATLA